MKWEAPINTRRKTINWGAHCATHLGPHCNRSSRWRWTVGSRRAVGLRIRRGRSLRSGSLRRFRNLRQQTHTPLKLTITKKIANCCSVRYWHWPCSMQQLLLWWLANINRRRWHTSGSAPKPRLTPAAQMELSRRGCRRVSLPVSRRGERIMGRERALEALRPYLIIACAHLTRKLVNERRWRTQGRGRQHDSKIKFFSCNKKYWFQIADIIKLRKFANYLWIGLRILVNFLVI